MSLPLEFQSGCVQHMKELRGGTSLIDYCLNMSTLLELREKRREYLMGGSKTEQQERYYNIEKFYLSIHIIFTYFVMEK